MQREELISLCRVIAKMCHRLDSRIVCELTDQISEYEHTEALMRKQFGDPSNGKSNIGRVHVHLFIPGQAVKNEEVGDLLHQLEEHEQVARVFCSFGNPSKRIDGSVRSDDAGIL